MSFRAKSVSKIGWACFVVVFCSLPGALGALGMSVAQAQPQGPSCDGSATNHCCLCGSGPFRYCFEYTGNGVLSCTSEFCSTTKCDLP